CPFSLFFLFSGGGISLFQFPAVLFLSVSSFQAAGFLFFNFPLSFSLGFFFSGGGILVFPLF
ncbi:MAG: hypothetical protein J5739_01895, partial [Lachnospiraceae bacterium]|nr:hypothetical protein [Lachnospiraceae bacterium]